MWTETAGSKCWGSQAEMPVETQQLATAALGSWAAIRMKTQVLGLEKIGCEKSGCLVYYSKKSIAPYIFIDEDELCIFSSLGLESPPSRKFELDIFFGHHKAGFWTAQGPKPKGHLWALQRRWDFGHQGLQPHLARLEHPGRTISFMARTPTLSEFKQGLTTRRSTKNMVCMWLSMIGMKGLQTLVVYGYINFSFVDSLYICIFWFFNYEDRDLWVERRQWLETLGNTCERVTCEDL